MTFVENIIVHGVFWDGEGRRRLELGLVLEKKSVRSKSGIRQTCRHGETEGASKRHVWRHDIDKMTVGK